jgi:hypothetical protein
MIDRDLALQLKHAGLDWTPVERDAFAIDAAELDDQVFVVSQFTALPQRLRGEPGITFHGSAEWALDYVLLADAIWLPSEAQLRNALEARLPNSGVDILRLERTGAGYRCLLSAPHHHLEFNAAHAADAYGLALLHTMTHGL